MMHIYWGPCSRRWAKTLISVSHLSFYISQWGQSWSQTTRVAGTGVRNQTWIRATNEFMNSMILMQDSKPCYIDEEAEASPKSCRANTGNWSQDSKSRLIWRIPDLPLCPVPIGPALPTHGPAPSSDRMLVQENSLRGNECAQAEDRLDPQSRVEICEFGRHRGKALSCPGSEPCQ